MLGKNAAYADDDQPSGLPHADVTGQLPDLKFTMVPPPPGRR